jgi:hypothetical protein
MKSITKVISFSTGVSFKIVFDIIVVVVFLNVFLFKNI